MSMRNRALFAAVCMCLAYAVGGFAVTYNVAKNGSAPFSTIQAAVDRTQPGDVVNILDAATYPEQVTIDSTHNGITLTSSNPTALNKPKIVWQDVVNVHPATYAESQIDSMINFDRNGALRILGAKNVTVNGIAVDGGGPFVFGYPSIWNHLSDLIHGNAAITIWVSSGAHIVNCDLSNSYFGINFKDRNQGGIFANANQADLQPQNIVPMSGFGKTGNHIIEYNRVHNNSYGMFFESAWDLGSTIRYNLIFENHHQTTAFAQKVKTLTPQEGGNQPGGALFFKDVAYSPLSIYNNTFWHNFLIFVGGWRTGLQHLVFNNIYAKPFTYWGNNAYPFSSGAYMEISSFLPNRMYNCIYTCQSQAPQQYYVAIMNNFPQVQGVNNQPPAQGALLSSTTINGTGAFPATANIRWIEMDSTKFQSMDPATVNFLAPNWSDPVLAQYVKNQGWQKSGVKNMDGSWADIGAVASDNGRPTDLASIRPTDPVTMLTPTSAKIIFSIDGRVGKIQNPVAKLFRFVGNLPTLTPTAWSGIAGNIITAANINDVTLPPTPALQVGINTYTVTIPVAQTPTSDYAFFETVIEGTDVNGKKYTASTGFLPYRNLNYKFIVQIWNYAQTKQLDSVRVGDTVILTVIPQTKTGALFTNTIKPVDVSLGSGYTLWNAGVNPMTKLAYDSIKALSSSGVNRMVMFTKVPTGGNEIVSLSGVWKAPTDTQAFQGSTSIRIVPGSPATVVFQDPPSKTFNINPPPTLPQGAQYPGLLWVYDKYGNRTNSSASVTLSSLTPATGNFVGANPNLVITTNDTGAGLFSVSAVSSAAQGSPVRLQALLTQTNDYDTAFMVVGPPVGKLFIFYGDTAGINPAARLEGQVGDRLPVTIIASKASNPTMKDIDTSLNVTFTIAGTAGLIFYDSPTASSPPAVFTLVKGRISVWVSSADVVDNGQMTAITTGIGPSDPRQNIYFIRPLVSVDSAFYYSRSGWGIVDSVDIFYKEKLTMLPDSITLFWPGADSGKRVITGTSDQLKMFSDSMHITIALSAPFAPLITASTTTSKQGISYNRPNNNPGVMESASPFAIKERVGPLIMTAQVVERIPPNPGVDTLFVSFSEQLQSASLNGAALSLIKNGVSTALTLQSATNLIGNVFKIVLTSSNVYPQVGDSLRIAPSGPITDALGNPAHPLNRPVIITLKPIPAGIVGGYYIDNDASGRADGVVDSVIIAFNKKVSLNDLVVSLNWGSVIHADSLTSPLMRFVNSGDSIVEISVMGQFNIPPGTIKTSGIMDATIRYNSIPGEAVKGAVADSAPPVVVDTAAYCPGPGNATGFIDTLYVTFSEQIKSIGPGQLTPFNLISSNNANYTMRLLGSTISTLKNSGVAGEKYTYQFLLDSVIGVSFPQTGDSLWINSDAGVTDAAGNVQTNGNNRKVLLHVYRNAFKPVIKTTISKNPFSPSNESFELKFTATIPRMVVFNNIMLFASGKVFDVLGNCVHVFDDDTLVLTSVTGLTHNTGNKPIFWNGRDQNGRLVGSGVYQAIFLFKSSDGQYNGVPQRIKIGVKR